MKLTKEQRQAKKLFIDTEWKILNVRSDRLDCYKFKSMCSLEKTGILSLTELESEIDDYSKRINDGIKTLRKLNLEFVLFSDDDLDCKIKDLLSY